MHNALAAANFFIDAASADFDDDMTNLKVNKMIYFVQGWSMVLFGDIFFSDAIEAWDHGPVVRNVYDTFKHYGNQRIKEPSPEYSSNIFSSEQKRFLADVFLEYDRFTGAALRGMTHRPGTPWSEIYESKMNHVITPKALQTYFLTQPTLPRFDIRKATANIPSVGYRDADGYLVLPSELNDEF